MCVAVCCSVLQCVAECVAVCCSVLQCVAVCVAVCCSVLQCVAECVAVCYSALHVTYEVDACLTRIECISLVCIHVYISLVCMHVCMYVFRWIVCMHIQCILLVYIHVHPTTFIEIWIICLDPVSANSEKCIGSQCAVRVGQRLQSEFGKSGAARKLGLV